MINLRVSKVITIVFISILLIGCSTKDGNEEIIKKYLNADTKILNDLPERFQLLNEVNRVISDGIDKDYKELNGNINVLNIYAVDKIDRKLEYNSNFSAGNVRVVLIKANGEVEDIVKGNGKDSITVKIPAGKSYIRLIGSKATGNLQISMPKEIVDDLDIASKFREDGEYIFYNNNITKGENLSVKLFHIKIVNKKLDKIAKITLEGKIKDGKALVPFNNDGWGNYGMAEVLIKPGSSNPESITIKFDNKGSKPILWGLKEGETFFSNDEELPDFLKGL